MEQPHPITTTHPTPQEPSPAERLAEWGYTEEQYEKLKSRGVDLFDATQKEQYEILKDKNGHDMDLLDDDSFRTFTIMRELCIDLLNPGQRGAMDRLIADQDAFPEEKKKRLDLRVEYWEKHGAPPPRELGLSGQTRSRAKTPKKK